MVVRTGMLRLIRAARYSLQPCRVNSTLACPVVAPDRKVKDMENIKKGYFMIDKGYPSQKTAQQCMGILADAAQDAMKTEDGLSGMALQYGPSQGSVLFREEVAKLLSSEYKETVHRENIQLTSGATQGLFFTVSQFLGPESIVFVQDPTYHIAIQIFKEDLGSNVIAVRSDGKGLDLDDFERAILEHKAKASPKTEKKPYWAMLYTIPTFNNPTGGCYPDDRSRRLVDMAREHGILVFCDDVYNILNYSDDGSVPRRLYSYEREMYGDDNGHVISNGSFSKIFAPGLRLGWIEASSNIIHRLVESNLAWSGGSFNHYGSYLISTAMQSGRQQALLRDLCAEYKNRVRAVEAVLKAKLPSFVKYTVPKGGYFYWLEFPENFDTEKLLEICMDKYKTVFVPGKNFSPTGSYRNFARMSVSFCEEPVLVEGVSRFCDAVKEYMES